VACRYALLYCSQDLGISHLLSQHYQQCLHTNLLDVYFSQTTIGGQPCYYLDISSLENPRCLEGTEDQFEFPVRQFYEMSDSTWTLEKFKYFFVEKTSLFKQSNDNDLMALQSIYNFGAFAALFETFRPNMLAFRNPRFKRFAMNCHASVINKGEPCHMWIQDVSLHGLRAKCDNNLRSDEFYVLEVCVGATITAEVIAKLVWKGEDGDFGLEVSSGDQSWQRLIKYLENKHAATIKDTNAA
jgi:hypothetical protein